MANYILTDDRDILRLANWAMELSKETIENISHSQSEVSPCLRNN